MRANFSLLRKIISWFFVVALWVKTGLIELLFLSILVFSSSLGKIFLVTNTVQSTALLGIYILLITIQQILMWNYCWTTLSHKIIQKKCLLNYLYLLKHINFISMSGHFFVFSIHFFSGPISYWNFFSQNL